MDDRDYRAVVGEATNILVGGRVPFVQRVMSSALPHVAWTEELRRKDPAGGRRTNEYRPGDLTLMLRAMTERLGDAGHLFSQHKTRQAENYASEGRDRWAPSAGRGAQCRPIGQILVRGDLGSASVNFERGPLIRRVVNGS